MNQIVLDKPGSFRSQEVEQPVLRPGEALLRVHRVGICGTDLHAFAGRQPFFTYPRVLGHEIGAEVVTVDGTSGLRPGDRCCVEPYVNCNECAACKSGHPNCCETLRVLGVHVDGAMQPYITVPSRLLHRSTQLNFDQLALVETLGIGAHAVRRSGLSATDTALIIGAGPIGLAIAQFAKLTGAQIRILELSPARREFASRFGIEAVEKFDGTTNVVFDATGNVASMEKSFDYVAHAGRLVFVGIVQNRISFDDPQFHRREITLLASRNSQGLFPEIIQLIEQGKVDTSPWITDQLPLADIPTQFATLRERPHLIKAMIEVD